MNSENMFTCSKYSESSLDEVDEVAVPLLLDGRRTTMSDVRRLYGGVLGLTPAHKPYCNERLLTESEAVAAGSSVVWKQDAKNRG